MILQETIDFVRTINIPYNIFLRGTFFVTCDLIEMGMQTPMIHKNDGKMKSAGWMPFHVACSSHSYLPAPLFANIIVTMANPRNVSKLHKRDDPRRGALFSLSLVRRSSLFSCSDDVGAAVVACIRLRRNAFAPLTAPHRITAMAHINSKAIRLRMVSILWNSLCENITEHEEKDPKETYTNSHWPAVGLQWSHNRQSWYSNCIRRTGPNSAVLFDNGEFWNFSFR